MDKYGNEWTVDRQGANVYKKEIHIAYFSRDHSLPGMPIVYP
jgi:hypothetical protein